MKFSFRNSRLCFYSMAAGLTLLLGAASALAAPIHGVVTNGTTNKPAAGDAVALIRMQQGMQVADRATTDASGRYTLNVSDSDPVHLVRVTHQGANYFEAAPSGKNTVDVKVYDVAERVAGVSTEADLQWVQTDADHLQIMEIFVVKNESSPPRTQFGPRPYDFYLPKGAEVLSSAALAPGSMPVRSAPKPAGPAGLYTFDFPIRPGETHFQVSYRLPYSGNFEIHPRFASNIGDVVLILPKSMQFAAKPAETFRSVDASPNVQTYLAKGVTPASKLAIRITGTGQLPQQNDSSTQSNAQSAPQSPEAAAQQEADNNTRPGIGLGVPLGTPSPLDKYKWWIISLVVILLAAGAGVLMKQSGATPAAASAPGASGTTPPPGGLPPATVPSADGNTTDHRTELLAALREELFRLESDRLAGKLTPEEYDRQKSALEIVLKRAVEHDPAPAVADSTV